MTLTYWTCENLSDSKVYNIRAKTKKEAAAMRIEFGEDHFGLPVKQVVEYADAFDLINQALGEGGVERFPIEYSSPSGETVRLRIREDAWGSE